MCHAQATPPGFLNGVDWIALVEGLIGKTFFGKHINIFTFSHFLKKSNFLRIFDILYFFLYFVKFFKYFKIFKFVKYFFLILGFLDFFWNFLRFFGLCSTLLRLLLNV